MKVQYKGRASVRGELSNLDRKAVRRCTVMRRRTSQVTWLVRPKWFQVLWLLGGSERSVYGVGAAMERRIELEQVVGR